MTLDEFLSEWNNGADTVLVHTSGSTGSPKPLHVEKRRMAASARTTCQFLGLNRGDTALLCMPLDYIAGKMMVVRSIIGGLKLISVPPSGHPLRGLTIAPTFAAMVPLQVYNSLQTSEERLLLMQIKHLIIGGGAIDEQLESQLSELPNAVWSTYGMTETLSHIALRRINGAEASLWYSPFSGVNVSLSADDCLVIDAPEVCSTRLITNDRAVIHTDGRRFRILGRKDNVVCSGGLKLQIEELERKLWPYISVPFMLTKIKDRKLGEALVMLLQHVDVAEAQASCQQYLTKYEQPRHYLCVSQLPLTVTGKPARAEAMLIAEQNIQETASLRGF